MSLSEDQLKDGSLYDILSTFGGRFPSAKWCAGRQCFVQEWTDARGRTIRKEIAIEDVALISDFTDVPI